MRKAFSDTLVKVARQDAKVVFLTGDLGFQVFDDFIREFPTRYLNVGVAYHNLPVMVVGAGGGFTYAKAGVTHHAADDLALMGTLPGMSLVTPGGPDELRELMPQMLKLAGPSYLRVGKFGEPEIGHTSCVELGKARKLLDGEGVAVITSGDIVSDIYPKLKDLQAPGVHPALYHFHTVKPVDRGCLEEIASRFDLAIVVEESIPQGGLYQEICRWKAETDSPLKIVRRGAPDAFVLGNPTREELRCRIGVDGDALTLFLTQMHEV